MLFLLLKLIVGFNKLAAQTMSYSIGFATNLTINSIEVPSNTYPLIGAEGNKCIKIDNGLSKFLPSASQLFATACIVDLPKESLQVLLYPNPVISDYIIVKAVSTINTTGQFLIKIMDLNGRTTISRSATMAELFQGVRISNISMLLKNIYLVNVSSEKDKISVSNKLVILK